MWGLYNLLRSAGQVRLEQPDGRHHVFFLATTGQLEAACG
jgi:hypothetical protein